VRLLGVRVGVELLGLSVVLTCLVDVSRRVFGSGSRWGWVVPEFRLFGRGQTVLP